MISAWQAWCVACDAPVPSDKRGCVACRSANPRRQRALRTNRPVALGAFCAICVEGVRDLRAVQLEPGGTVYTVCRACDEHRAPPQGETARRWYVPLDETLERMPVRLLQALRHFDWTSTDELAAAMGIEDSERKGYRRTLAYSVRRGLVECDRRQHAAWRYRITPAGRASYAAALGRSAT